MSTLEPLFLIGSFSFLQVTRTTIKAWMSLNFGGIPPLTSELAALDQFKKSFIREYSKYLMTCCQVSDRCPLGYLLRGSSSYLQVTRTSIISWMSSNFSKIQPRTAELAALEHLKKIP